MTDVRGFGGVGDIHLVRVGVIGVENPEVLSRRQRDYLRNQANTPPTSLVVDTVEISGHYPWSTPLEAVTNGIGLKEGLTEEEARRTFGFLIQRAPEEYKGRLDIEALVNKYAGEVSSPEEAGERRSLSDFGSVDDFLRFRALSFVKKYGHVMLGRASKMQDKGIGAMLPYVSAELVVGNPLDISLIYVTQTGVEPDRVAKMLLYDEEGFNRFLEIMPVTVTWLPRGRYRLGSGGKNGEGLSIKEARDSVIRFSGGWVMLEGNKRLTNTALRGREIITPYVEISVTDPAFANNLHNGLYGNGLSDVRRLYGSNKVDALQKDLYDRMLTVSRSGR